LAKKRKNNKKWWIKFKNKQNKTNMAVSEFVALTSKYVPNNEKPLLYGTAGFRSKSVFLFPFHISFIFFVFYILLFSLMFYFFFYFFGEEN